MATLAEPAVVALDEFRAAARVSVLLHDPEVARPSCRERLDAQGEVHPMRLRQSRETREIDVVVHEAACLLPHGVQVWHLLFRKALEVGQGLAELLPVEVGRLVWVMEGEELPQGLELRPLVPEGDEAVPVVPVPRVDVHLQVRCVLLKAAEPEATSLPHGVHLLIVIRQRMPETSAVPRVPVEAGLAIPAGIHARRAGNSQRVAGLDDVVVVASICDPGDELFILYQAISIDICSYKELFQLVVRPSLPIQGLQQPGQFLSRDSAVAVQVKGVKDLEDAVLGLVFHLNESRR
mmetsp:Transcript_55619/g.120101  ORF Transcript_55619/g.120101 Transcript_55619/m.120101 type:complete len:293 (+) Transcript_55619:933-1811(+)